MKRQNANDNISVLLMEEREGNLCLVDKSIKKEMNFFRMSNITMAQVLKDEKDDKKEGIKKRKAPSVFYFSKEVQLLYSIVERRGIKRGLVSYRGLMDNSNETGLLIDHYEKGLSFSG